MSVLFSGCENPELQIKKYGYGKEANENLFASINLSKTNNYGQLLDKIRLTTCNDSIPQIVLKDENGKRIIFPTAADCNPPPFDPQIKHYVTILKGEPYYPGSLKPINLDSLNWIIQNNYVYKGNDGYRTYFVVVESNRNEKIKGIKKFLIQLTKAFDKIDTKLNLNIAFWEIVPNIPPPPKE